MADKKNELYIPRKCSATNRLIYAKDRASVQINIGHVDENGVYIRGEYTTFALSGFIRKMGQADQAINRLSAEHGLMTDLGKMPTQFDYE